MPPTEEMDPLVVIRDLADRLAFLALLGWDTDVPIALAEVEEVLAELEAKLFLWRTSSPSMLRMPPQDQCT